MAIQSITIIGSGNVAWHLAKMLFAKGYQINEVFSRNIEHATDLANLVNAKPINSIGNLSSSSDIYLVAVSDSSITEINDKINFIPKLIVHTAGSVPMRIFDKFPNYGVFYPYQTLTKNVEVKNSIPICVEANSTENLKLLNDLAKEITVNVSELNSEQRKQCHMAAVFANNFTNHFYALAEKLLSEKGISFDVIKPLIFETAEKIREVSPQQAQTGPARRNDQAIIQDHIGELSSEHLEKLYSFVSQSIIETNSNKE